MQVDGQSGGTLSGSGTEGKALIRANGPGARQGATEAQAVPTAPASPPQTPPSRFCACVARLDADGGLEDGGVRSLPGCLLRDASAAPHPPHGEVAAGTLACSGAQGFRTPMGSRLSAVAGRSGEVTGSGPGEGHGGGRGGDAWLAGLGGLPLSGAGRAVPTGPIFLLQPALLRPPALRGAATFAQALQNVPETQVSVLDNGLRVASEQSSHPTCTVSAARAPRTPARPPAVVPGVGCDLGLLVSVFWVETGLLPGVSLYLTSALPSLPAAALRPASRCLPRTGPSSFPAFLFQRQERSDDCLTMKRKMRFQRL